MNFKILAFGVALKLFFKTSSGAQPIPEMTKFSCAFIAFQIKLISISKVVQLDSFRKRGKKQLGNCDYDIVC